MFLSPEKPSTPDEAVPEAVPTTSQTHAAKEAPDFNRGRNWRTAWGK